MQHYTIVILATLTVAATPLVEGCNCSPADNMPLHDCSDANEQHLVADGRTNTDKICIEYWDN